MNASPPARGDEFSRAVGATTREGQEARTVSLSRTFDAAPEEVWDAIADPERLPRWFLPVTGDPRNVGDHFQLEGNAGGEVLACERPRRLAVSWVLGGQSSLVEVTLSPHGDATVLRLDHTVPVDDHWREFGPGAVGLGWELALAAGLAGYLAEAAGVAPGRARSSSQAGSGEMAQQIADASAAWVDADIAAGAHADDARAAGARCRAFYTGQGG